MLVPPSQPVLGRGWGNPIQPLHPASRLPLYRARARSASGIRFSSFQKKVHEIPLVRAPGKASCFHCLGRARIFGFFIIRNSSIFSRAQILPTSRYFPLLTLLSFPPFHLSPFTFLFSTSSIPSFVPSIVPQKRIVDRLALHRTLKT
jgi:hypothetical protein